LRTEAVARLIVIFMAGHIHQVVAFVFDVPVPTDRSAKSSRIS